MFYHRVKSLESNLSFLLDNVKSDTTSFVSFSDNDFFELDTEYEDTYEEKPTTMHEKPTPTFLVTPSINDNTDPNEIFWIKCGLGDVRGIKRYLELSSIDVNCWYDDDGKEYKRWYNKLSVTPLMRATIRGQREIIRILLQHPKIEVNLAEEMNKETALHMAVNMKYMGIMQMLLSFPQTDPNVADWNGKTPFYMACESGENTLVKVLLADENIDVNREDESGWSPLYAACYNGHVSTVEAIIDDPRINVNGLCTGGGDTPLLAACRKGHSDVANILIKHGNIDLSARNGSGKTALELAATNHMVNIVYSIAQQHVAANESIDNALKGAMIREDAAVVKAILDASIIDVDENGVTLTALFSEDPNKLQKNSLRYIAEHIHLPQYANIFTHPSVRIQNVWIWPASTKLYYLFQLFVQVLYVIMLNVSSFYKSRTLLHLPFVMSALLVSGELFQMAVCSGKLFYRRSLPEIQSPWNKRLEKLYWFVAIFGYPFVYFVRTHRKGSIWHKLHYENIIAVCTYTGVFAICYVTIIHNIENKYLHDIFLIVTISNTVQTIWMFRGIRFLNISLYVIILYRIFRIIISLTPCIMMVIFIFVPIFHGIGHHDEDTIKKGANESQLDFMEKMMSSSINLEESELHIANFTRLSHNLSPVNVLWHMLMFIAGGPQQANFKDFQYRSEIIYVAVHVFGIWGSMAILGIILGWNVTEIGNITRNAQNITNAEYFKVMIDMFLRANSLRCFGCDQRAKMTKAKRQSVRNSQRVNNTSVRQSVRSTAGTAVLRGTKQDKKKPSIIKKLAKATTSRKKNLSKKYAAKIQNVEGPTTLFLSWRKLRQMFRSQFQQLEMELRAISTRNATTNSAESVADDAEAAHDKGFREVVIRRLAGLRNHQENQAQTLYDLKQMVTNLQRVLVENQGMRTSQAFRMEANKTVNPYARAVGMITIPERATAALSEPHNNDADRPTFYVPANRYTKALIPVREPKPPSSPRRSLDQTLNNAAQQNNYADFGDNSNLCETVKNPISNVQLFEKTENTEREETQQRNTMPSGPVAEEFFPNEPGPIEEGSDKVKLLNQDVFNIRRKPVSLRHSTPNAGTVNGRIPNGVAGKSPQHQSTV